MNSYRTKKVQLNKKKVKFVPKVSCELLRINPTTRLNVHVTINNNMHISKIKHTPKMKNG